MDGQLTMAAKTLARWCYARGLDERMQEIREQGGKLLSLEAVAVMAALNLSHELLRQQRQAIETETVINRQVQDLLQKLDAFLREAAL